MLLYMIVQFWCSRSACLCVPKSENAICKLIFLCLTFMYFNFLYKETIARVVLCCVVLH